MKAKPLVLRAYVLLACCLTTGCATIDYRATVKTVPPTESDIYLRVGSESQLVAHTSPLGNAHFTFSTYKDAYTISAHPTGSAYDSRTAFRLRDSRERSRFNAAKRIGFPAMLVLVVISAAAGSPGGAAVAICIGLLALSRPDTIGLTLVYDASAVVAEQTPAHQEPVTSPPATSDQPNRASTADRMRELKKLRDEGLVSDDDYESKKKQLLDGL